MITPAEAIREAERAAQQLLASSSRWRASLDGRVAQTPLLIERLDANEPYYIVPFTREGKETARLIIDATTGEFEEINAIEEPGQSLPIYVVPAAAAGPPRQLVWQPCRESSSPFLPFYLMTTGQYVRVDGVTYAKLTLDPA